TPEHIRAIVTAVRDCKPRSEPDGHYAQSETLQLSGLEPLNITPEFGFAVIGERTNITGSPKFSKLILSDDFDGALAVARQQVKGGANMLDVNMDEGMIDSEATMTRFLNLLASEPEIARIPIIIDSSKWSVIEAGLKCVQGKAVVNSISLKNGEEEFLREARLIRPYGEAMHAAFLFHAIRAGLDMAIVNAGQLAVYEEIQPELRERVEDVLLNRRDDATERLVEFAENIKAKGKTKVKDEVWRAQPVEER